MLAAASCGGKGPPSPPDLPAVGSQVSLFRFPKGGGPVRAYHPDSLTAMRWQSQKPVPALGRLLGADPDERLLWAVDAEGNLISVDLESRGVRAVAGGLAAATLAPDGSLYLVDTLRRVTHLVRRQPVRFHAPLPASPRVLYGAVNEQLLAFTGGANPRLLTANADQDLHSTPLPPGEIGVTTWGDLVAVATDSALVLFETGGQRSRSSIESVHHAKRVAFSPSGHRLYVSRDNAEIQVYDRFSLRQLTSIELPGPPKEFKVDASGRWLLVHPVSGDSLWVVDLATNQRTGSVAGSWGPDLPLVAGAATLIVRVRSDLKAFDLKRSPPVEIASLEDGGADLWLAAAWVPPERVPAAVAAAESASVTQDSALRADTVQVAGTDSTALYLQISRTQNPDWADLLNRQLKSDGYPASILQPKEPEDGYRVVVGPFSTREAAESTGKLLGRAYFIIRLPAKSP